MKAKWMCAAATVALLAGGLSAGAQVSGEKKQEPGATSQQQSPSTGAKKSPSTTPGSSGASSAQDSDAKKPESAQGKIGNGTKQSGASKDSTTKSTQSKDDAATGDRASQKEDGTSGKSSAQSPSGAKNKGTAQSRDKGDMPERAGKAESDDDTDRRASGKSDEQRTTREGSKDATEDTAGAKTGARDEDIQLSERERTTIQESIDLDEARVDVDFNVGVGATVPRRIDLRPLPAAIIDINPRWRSFRYVVVENEIVIINPQTYRVVEVIPASGSRQARASGGARAEVRLNPQQRQRILTYARAECATVLADPDFEVGVGVRIPEQIELCPFEDVVIQEVDVVRPYRFFVVRNEVVLVDPSTHTIVEVVR